MMLTVSIRMQSRNQVSIFFLFMFYCRHPEIPLGTQTRLVLWKHEGLFSCHFFLSMWTLMDCCQGLTLLHYTLREGMQPLKEAATINISLIYCISLQLSNPV